MPSSYRNLVNNAAVYQAELRDTVVTVNGMVVIAEVPVTENATDLYSDYDATAVNRFAIPVIPLFDKYYLLLNTLGDDVEETIPLEVIVRTSDFLPRNTRLSIESRTQDGLVRLRRWKVLSTEVKHIDSYYTKVAHCVPERSVVQTLD